MEKSIAYVGEFDFPLGDPGSIRVLSNGKIFRDIGYDVSFFCHKGSKSLQPVSGEYQGFYFSKKSIPNNKIIRMGERLIRGINTLALLKENTQNYPEIIVYYGNSSRFLFPLLSFARRNKIKLLVDVAEWYDYSHLPFGKYGPVALDVHFALTRLIPKCDGVIGISSYLTDYYSSRGVKSIRIPQLYDMHEEKWNFSEPESFDPQSLNLVYAGVPGRKDLIGNAVRGLKILKAKGNKVKLHLFGPSMNDVRLCLDKDAPLVDELQGTSLIFHGRISPERIPSMLAKADFSILLRPDARYANAGFPTKLVESFAAGLPIIANLTSDIGMYLRDGDNGIVLEDWSVETFVRKICELNRLPNARIKQMKKAARIEAVRSFDYRNYIDNIKHFL